MDLGSTWKDGKSSNRTHSHNEGVWAADVSEEKRSDRERIVGIGNGRRLQHEPVLCDEGSGTGDEPGGSDGLLDAGSTGKHDLAERGKDADVPNGSEREGTGELPDEHAGESAVRAGILCERDCILSERPGDALMRSKHPGRRRAFDMERPAQPGKDGYRRLTNLAAEESLVLAALLLQ